jgi:hypothetical protein
LTLRGLTNMRLPFSLASAPPRSTTAYRGRVWLIRILASALAALAFAAVSDGPGHAENAEISSRRASERRDFTYDEIKDGFLKIALNAELQLGAQAERVRKFAEPVRIFVVSNGLPDRRPELAAIIADIRNHVNHLDMAVTDDRQVANFFVTLVADRDLNRTIRSRYGTGKAKRIQQSLNPQCLSGIGKDSRYRIRRAEVILPVDAGEFTFYDCAYEELLQALGAINDDRSIPWTMFNDDVQMGFFDVYDQHLLNILYDPRVSAGMTKEEVSGILPEVLPSVRAWVTKANLPHHVDGRSALGESPTQGPPTELLRNAQTSQGVGPN